ncbi:TonB-dependent receptor [Hyphomicrobium sulfonivorans]|uniref:TonB-dependent receptor n=1 Tax=Hyphomicrobium sulfonivorans TaxID=121290 RepID=A0A120CWB8_HYPSL|nr:TonB-dependent receptor [Hyphomicrobium sulfonivorans]
MALLICGTLATVSGTPPALAQVASQDAQATENTSSNSSSSQGAVALEPITVSPQASPPKVSKAPRRAVVSEPITVTSERGWHPVSEVPQNVTVLSGEDIDKRAVRDIDDLLRYVPGTRVDRETSLNNPFGQLGSFQIRGVGGNRVQILVDGSRIQEQTIYGSRDFVDPFNMQAVEIVRGPSSVLWGADALGGVVAFRTRDPEDLLAFGDKPWAADIKLAYDSFDKSFRKQITAAAESGDFQVLASLGHLSAREPRLRNARADGGIWGCTRPSFFGCDKLFSADTEAVNGLAKIIWTPENHEFRLTGEFFNRNTGVDQVWDAFAAMSGYSSLSYPRELDMERMRFTLEHTWAVKSPLIDEFKWQLSYSPQNRDTSGTQTRRFAARTDLYSPIRNYGETFLEADVQITSRFNTWPISHKLVYGFDGDIMQSAYDGYNVVHRSDTGLTTIVTNQGYNFPEVETSRADFYIQDEMKFLDGRLTVTPGLRYATYRIDPTGDTGYKPLPGNEPQTTSKSTLIKKLGMVYELNSSYSVYASYGEGFKMPTSQQLFVSANDPFIGGIVLPNPSLKPESVKNYEAGIRGRFARGSFSAGIFYADYQDFIRGPMALNPATPNVWTYDNVENVELWGIEFSGEYEFYATWWATAAVSYQYGVQALTGASETPFDGAVPLTTTLGVRHLMQEWNLEAEVLATFGSKVTRRSNPDAFLPSGYAVFDGYLSWKPRSEIEINAGVLNIFDTRYFPNSLYGYLNTPVSASTIGANPLEVQTAPGRTFKLGSTFRF